MIWLLFALTGPVFWALSTHIDKYLVERYFKESDTAVLMIFTSLVGVLMLPFIRYFVPAVFSLSLTSVLVMMASGALYMGAMLFYLRALQGEEASVIAPLFQLSTLFTLALAYLLLHETLSRFEFAGGALIVAGALLLSLDSRFRFRAIKTRLVVLMLAATFVLALSTVIFKLFAVEDSFWATTFWTYAGEALFGIGLICVPAYLRQFTALIKTNVKAVLGINGANELVNLAGGLGVRYASLLAPVALVSAISSTTTLFVFAFGILLTSFFPRFGREDLSARNLAQKGAAAVLVTIGIVLANL